MENSYSHQFLKPLIPADDHRIQFELYTIPSSAGWFSWDNIHEIEKNSVPEFFDNSSLTRNPRVYKEYRDFIISKFRELPSTRLTFSQVRKSLVGDVTYLFKVFNFLDKHGLINYGLPVTGGEDKEEWKVKVEDGPPHGVRVVAIPNSLKPVFTPAGLGSVSCGNDGGLLGSDFKIPPLSSHLDVYQDLIELICGNCKERCQSGHYEYTKEGSSIICVKCFKNGAFGTNKSIDDFKLFDHTPDNENRVAIWTEAETLLLLESVLKHGDDWDLVAQNVQTKSKLDCISKLIQLPFGQLMLGSTYDKCKYQDTDNSTNNQKLLQGGSPPPAPQQNKDAGIQNLELENESQQNGDADSEGPPAKRICIAPISDSSDPKTDEQVTEDIREKESQICELKNQKQLDGNLSDRSKLLPNASNSVLQQIARISAVVGPHVAASAAEAAVTALCDENEIPKEIFDSEENGYDSEMDVRPNDSEKGVIPLPLRMRATSATVLGAAAAHAKLLAIEEDREVERLVSTVINTQLKKLQYKMELLNEVEMIMEKEFTQMSVLEDSLLTERMDVVQKAIDAGISRWRDGTLA